MAMFGNIAGLGGMSQGYTSVGMSQGPSQGLSQDSPAKQRQEENQTCMAVTVRILEDALIQQGEGALRVHGVEASNLILVGLVEDLVRQPTSLEFTINDTSGRLKARHYFTEMNPELDRIQEGRYACIVGTLRTSPMVHFSANLCVMPVGSADQVAYHMIEAAHVALKLQGRGKPPASPAKTPNPVLEVPTPFNAVGAAAPLDGEKLRAAVLAFLQQEAPGTGELGLAIAACAGHFPSVPGEQLRAALTDLVDNGDAYNTIDDDHFALL